MKVWVAVFAALLSVVASNAQVNHWAGRKCTRVSYTRAGRYTKKVERIAVPSCTTFAAARFLYASVQVKVSKTDFGNQQCSNDMAVFREGSDWSGNLIGTVCNSGDQLPENGAMEVSAYFRSVGQILDTYEVTVDVKNCKPEDVGTITGCQVVPTKAPTNRPSATDRPTRAPTNRPTTRAPTKRPTKRPTASPTNRPTTGKPTKSPTTLRPTRKPTTAAPTLAPTPPTLAPTKAPTKPCETLTATDVEQVLTVDSIEDANPTCWAISGSGSGKYVSAKLSINWADPSDGCSRESVSLYSGTSNQGTLIGGEVCAGQNLLLDAAGLAMFAELKRSAASFGQGFTLSYQLKDESLRPNRVVCQTLRCIQTALKKKGGKRVGNRGVGIKRGPRPTDPNADAGFNVTLIEIDTEVLVLTSPILVPVGTKLVLQPKPPLSSATLDGAKLTHLVEGAVDSYISASNIEFARGFSQKDGGAIQTQGMLEIKYCTFTDNAAKNGGAVSAVGKGVFSEISNSVFQRNAAMNGGKGGAIAVLAGGISLKKNYYSGNAVAATSTGSVAYVESGHLEVDSHSTYLDNTGQDAFFTLGSSFSSLA